MAETLQDQIRAKILKDPNKDSEAIAKMFNSTAGYVLKQKTFLRQEGKLPAFDRTHRHKNHPALIEECEEKGIPVENVKHYWHKGKHFSVFVKGKEIDLWELKDSVIAEMKEYAPRYPIIKYPQIQDAHLLVISPADIHIGKLCRAFETGDEYNHQIAIERVKSGIEGCIQKAASFNAEKILLIIGNDILHVDNAKSTTTSGTFQDSELMWFDAFKIAQKLLIECIETLLTVAPVHVQYDPSNHDYVSGFMLAQTIEAWFRNCEGITFNVSPSHRKYFRYHKNLIGTSHGDGAKEADLALLMAHEAEFWGACKHRYFYTNHLHHFRGKDHMSVTVQTLRSASGADSWHHKHGFQHAPKAIEAFIHHPEHGRIATITHLF